MPPPPPLPQPGRPPAPEPSPQPPNPSPLLRLKIQDLCGAAGARSFLSCCNAADVFAEAVETVINLLYPSQYRGSWPGTRSVTLVLGSFEGVAYTRGKAIDDDHKEIHLSTGYIASIEPGLLLRELTGVLVHEMVHCWQWNGSGSAPGGLVEGIADWVRLRADLSPPHWKRRTSGDRWDAGYQFTAWFLDWLEETYGPGTVPRLNHVLKDARYEEERYWSGQCGFHKSVQELWEEYRRWLADKEEVTTEKGEAEEGTNSENGAKAQIQVAGGGSEGERGHGPGSELDSGWTELSGAELELRGPRE